VNWNIYWSEILEKTELRRKKREKHTKLGFEVENGGQEVAMDCEIKRTMRKEIEMEGVFIRCFFCAVFDEMEM